MTMTGLDAEKTIAISIINRNVRTPKGETRCVSFTPDARLTTLLILDRKNLYQSRLRKIVSSGEYVRSARTLTHSDSMPAIQNTSLET